MLAFVPAATFPQFTPFFHPHEIVDARPHYVHQHQVSLDDLLEAEFFAQQRWDHALRVQQERRAHQLRLQEEQRQRRLALVRAERERRRLACLRQEQERTLLEAVCGRQLQHIEFLPEDAESLVAPLRQATAVRRQQAQAAARAQALQAAQQYEQRQAQLFIQALRQQAAEEAVVGWQAPQPTHPVSRQSRIPHGIRRSLHSTAPAPQQVPINAQSELQAAWARQRRKHVHFEEDDALSLLASLMAPSAAPVNHQPPVPSVATRSAPTSSQAASLGKDIKGKGKAVAEPGSMPIISPVPQREQSAADQVTVSDLLQGRLDIETDQEVRDTLQALVASLEPRSLQNPFTDSSSHQPIASTSGSRIPLASTLAASFSPSASAAPSETSPIPDTVQRRRSLESIRSLAQSFHTLADAFAFPPTLDFSRPSSPAAPASPGTPAGLAFTPNNAPLHQYENELGKLLAQLDEIDSNGDEEVRTRRKELVKEVEQALEKMDATVEARRIESEPREVPPVKAAVTMPAAVEAATGPISKPAQLAPDVKDGAAVSFAVADDQTTHIPHPAASYPTVNNATEGHVGDNLSTVEAPVPDTSVAEVPMIIASDLPNPISTHGHPDVAETGNQAIVETLTSVSEEASPVRDEVLQEPTTEPMASTAEMFSAATLDVKPSQQSAEHAESAIAHPAISQPEATSPSKGESSVDVPTVEIQPAVINGEDEVLVTESEVVAEDGSPAVDNAIDTPGDESLLDSTKDSVATITPADFIPTVAEEQFPQSIPAIQPVASDDDDASSELDLDLDSQASEPVDATFLLSVSRPTSPIKRRPSYNNTSDGDDVVLIDVGVRSDEDAWSEVDA